MCGQADDAEVVDDSDVDDVKVETAVAVELFLDPINMAEDLRACWAWFCPSDTPPDCSAAGIVARRASIGLFAPFALAFVGVRPLNYDRSALLVIWSRGFRARVPFGAGWLSELYSSFVRVQLISSQPRASSAPEYYY